MSYKDLQCHKLAYTISISIPGISLALQPPLFYTILLHIYCTCFSTFWHCHPYIPQHFNENVCFTLYTRLCLGGGGLARARVTLLAICTRVYSTVEPRLSELSIIRTGAVK